jgi:hypothetical protein
MKRILCLAVTTLAIGLMTTATHAQTGNLKLRFKAPFPFTVENKTFSAGEYDVTQPAHWFLLLRNIHTQSSAFEAAPPARHPKRVDGRTRLVFNRYGNKYFLVEVSDGSIESTYDLLKSKEEKRLADVTSRPRPNLVSVLSDGTIQATDDGE